ncbi:MAG TPA: hypothetical protein VJR92_15905 [Gemmatimonadaceae bacterium]|nr:hypothetical protein [Gemmatimonadaceae bacterium]
MRLPIHLIPVAMLALVGASHPPARGAAQQSATWSIADQPLVSIGDDGADTLILRATSALRLSNGTIVVASSRHSVLQWFDATGKHIRTVGRRGQGPAEFGSTIFLYDGKGDTVIAHDERNRRYHYLNARGEFVKLDTLGDARRAAWLYDKSAVYRTPGSVDFARLRTTLARIPFAPRDTVRHARIDNAGNVWIRTATEPQAYTIYSSDARLLGSITVPARFDPYQLMDTLVLGHWRDSDDIEHIQVRRLTRGRAPTQPAAAALPRAAYDQDAELREHRVTITRMQSLLRNVFTAQEAYFADNRRYAPTLDRLPGANSITAMPGLKATIFAAQPNSYRLLFEHAETRVACVALLESGYTPGPLTLCG